LSLKAISAERQLESGLEVLFASIGERDERLSLQLSQTSMQLQGIIQKLRSASDDVDLLAQNARDAGKVLEGQLRQSVKSAQIQQRTSQGFLELRQAMTDLVNQTHQELKTLNKTVVTLHRDPLAFQPFPWPSAWPRNFAMLIFDGIFHPNIKFIMFELIALLTIPLVRLLLVVLRVLLLSLFRTVWASSRLISRQCIKEKGGKQILDLEPEQRRTQRTMPVSAPWDIEGRQYDSRQPPQCVNIYDPDIAWPRSRVVPRRFISLGPTERQLSVAGRHYSNLSRIPQVPVHLYSRSSPDI